MRALGLALCVVSVGACAVRADDLATLRAVAVLDDGRVQPFDTWARENARRVSGPGLLRAESVMGLEPVAWTLALMADPQRWRRAAMIRVADASLRARTGLPVERVLFSHEELAASPTLRRALEDLQARRRQAPARQLAPLDSELLALGDTLAVLAGVFDQTGVHVLPPRPGEAGVWRALSDLDVQPSASDATLYPLREALLQAVRAGAAARVGPAAAALAQELERLALAAGQPVGTRRWEVHSNRVRPLMWAWLAYALGAVALLAGVAVRVARCGRLGLGLGLAGFLLHSYAIGLRVVIAGRPPVATLHESVLWVAWGSVLLACVLAATYRVPSLVGGAGGLASACLLVVLAAHPLGGALEPLVPVLRDNVWLSVHVLTITLGYSAFLLALAVAHVALLAHALRLRDAGWRARLALLLYRCVQVGTWLGVTGLLMGGFWASRAWGRFWGWDAKETATLASLLVYLGLLHARRAGLLGDFGLAVASVLAFLGVLWTWYGVNFVLRVGLHSYGFASGEQTWLVVVLACDLAFVAAASLAVRWRRLRGSD